RKLKRRLTFKGVDQLLAGLESKLYKSLFFPHQKTELSKEDIIGTLREMRNILMESHNSLFVDLVEKLINKVELFGLFFASLDIRQDSTLLAELLKVIAEKTEALPSNYESLSEEDKIHALLNVDKTVNPASIENEIQQDTLYTIEAIKTIQKTNGEEGCHRYIISHSTNPLSVLEVFGLFLLGGWEKTNLPIDIVPLFETIDDLRNAGGVMEKLYQNATYRQHLQARGNVQTIMLGFSDGTKDGGYLMANWSIYKAKEELSLVSQKYGIEVIFF